MALILTLLKSNRPAAVLLMLLAAASIYIIWLTLSRASLQVELANRNSELAAVTAGREAFAKIAQQESIRYQQRADHAAQRLTNLERELRNAPDAALTDRDLLMRTCLLKLRAGGECVFAGSTGTSAGLAGTSGMAQRR